MVLVVLLLGVFSIIRVFPVGFSVLRQAENRTLATRLANQLLEQVKSEEGSVPQGILFTYLDSSAGVPRLVTDANTLAEDPDDMSGYPRNNPNPYFSDVNKFRTVIGEPATIPPPSANVFGAGALYTIKFGPIFMDPAVGDREAVPGGTASVEAFNSYLRVYAAQMRGINVEAGAVGSSVGANGQDVSDNLRDAPQNYLIDYGNDEGGVAGGGDEAKIMVAPSRTKTRYYRMTFSYEEDNQIRSSGIVTLTVPPRADGVAVWQAIPLTASANARNLLVGSETVNRDFTRLPFTGANSAWDPEDPYEYKLVSSNVEPKAGRQSLANIGVLAFNPAGASYSERSATGQQPFMAFIDYAVLDWHILSETREVPSVFLGVGNAIPIKTTLGFIRRVGETGSDDSFYYGLYRDAQAPVDLQVFDLQGASERYRDRPDLIGTPLEGGDYAVRDPDKDYWLDFDERGGSYRTGTIYINSQRVPAGTQLRVLYKADGDWAVSMQKALTAYKPAIGDGGVFLPRPGNFDTFGKGNPAVAAERTRLYFHRNDLNKSIVATLEYFDAGEAKRLAPVQMTVDTAEGPYASVDVSQYVPRDRRAEFLAASTWRVIGPATGASMKVRVVWRDNVSTTNVWRIQDLDSYTGQAGRF